MNPDEIDLSESEDIAAAMGFSSFGPQAKPAGAGTASDNADLSSSSNSNPKGKNNTTTTTTTTAAAAAAPTSYPPTTPDGRPAKRSKHAGNASNANREPLGPRRPGGGRGTGPAMGIDDDASAAQADPDTVAEVLDGDGDEDADDGARGGGGGGGGRPRAGPPAVSTNARGDPVYWDASFVEDPWAGAEPRGWQAVRR